MAIISLHMSINLSGCLKFKGWLCDYRLIGRFCSFGWLHRLLVANYKTTEKGLLHDYRLLGISCSFGWLHRLLVANYKTTENVDYMTTGFLGDLCGYMTTANFETVYQDSKREFQEFKVQLGWRHDYRLMLREYTRIQSEYFQIWK